MIGCGLQRSEEVQTTVELTRPCDSIQPFPWIVSGLFALDGFSASGSIDPFHIPAVEGRPG